MLGAPLAVVAGARSDDVCVNFLGPPSLVSGFCLRGVLLVSVEWGHVRNWGRAMERAMAGGGGAERESAK